MRWRLVTAVVIGCVLAVPGVRAAEPGPAPRGPQAVAAIGPVTKLRMPRYVSLNARTINLRRGPGLDYRIDFEFHAKGLPVRVIDEYGHWRRVVDSEGDDGWVYHALLSGRRTVQVTAEGVLMRRRPVGLTEATDCRALAALPEDAAACAEQGAIAELLACQRFWCLVGAAGREGWVPKSAVWGVDPEEVFED
ncbi:hypothetical protein LNKW23_12770 [Paralimibaculum aggregatum]|uniref:SH3-like domain-containing protein n=1 Tax=Paralimibaculum aggregatum TaxID=3036245 RepID=A0ABQ6LN53_9RHOB|nr:SH3 domain-containing protein [Limibaculum sp. NKW23]GMG82064.1 hypothetical protein LNKW23_12770 [Limibaculum sp. NKW23]